MNKETLMEIGQKVVEIIFLAFVTTSLFLLLKHFIVSILKVITIYHIWEILKIIFK